MIKPGAETWPRTPWPPKLNAPGVKAKACAAAEMGERSDDRAEHREQHDDEQDGGELADLADLAEQRHHDQQRDADANRACQGQCCPIRPSPRESGSQGTGRGR